MKLYMLAMLVPVVNIPYTQIHWEELQTTEQFIFS